MDAISKHIVGALRDGGAGDMVGDIRGEDVIVDGRLLKPDEKIHDLVDIVHDDFENNSKKDREIIVIDGRVYERVSGQDEKVYDLGDVVEKGAGDTLSDPGFNDKIEKRIVEVAERIARELVPGIAEKVIREEIEKLRK